MKRVAATVSGTGYWYRIVSMVSVRLMPWPRSMWMICTLNPAINQSESCEIVIVMWYCIFPNLPVGG